MTQLIVYSAAEPVPDPPRHVRFRSHRARIGADGREDRKVDRRCPAFGRRDTGSDPRGL